MLQLSPVDTTTIVPLTSSHLESFSKLDKGRIIHSFLQGQIPYSRRFAAEGKKSFSVRDQNTPERGRPGSPTQDHEFGFGTPTLKPRVVISPSSHKKGERKTAQPTNRDSHKKDKVIPPVPVPDAMSKNRPASVHNSPKRSSKRALETKSDDDRAARLTERRQRKRTKRTILQGLDAVHSKPAPEKKGKGKKKEENKKPKIPVGLALMHGFSATNVGKNRLTLKPFPNVGVFGKGRASARTEVTSKKSKNGCLDNYFSEFEFLNKQRKVSPKPSQNTCESDPEQATELPPPSKRNKDLPTGRYKKPNDSPASTTSSASHSMTPADCEVPNDERETSSSVPAIPIYHSKEDSLACDPSHSRLIDTSVGSVAAVHDDTSPDSEDVLRKVEGMAPPFTQVSAPAVENIPSSPSLRPSQSASQNGRRVELSFDMNTTIEAVSRYFPQIVQGPPDGSVPPKHQPTMDTDYAVDFSLLPLEYATPQDTMAPEHTAYCQDTFTPNLLGGDGRDRENGSFLAFGGSSHPQLVSPSDSLERALRDYEPDDYVPFVSSDRKSFDLPDDYDYDVDYGSEVVLQGELPEPCDGLDLDDWTFSGQNVKPFDYEFSEDQNSHLEVDDEMYVLYGRDHEQLQDYSLPWATEVIEDHVMDEQNDYEMGSIEDSDPGIDQYDGECYTDYDEVEASECESDFGYPLQTLGGHPLDLSDGEGEPVLFAEQFSQGRALLLGTARRDNGDCLPVKPTSISRAEAAVVKSLRGHWLPQKH